MIAPDATTAPLRCLTIDVEDYFHIEATHGRISPEQWDRWPLRVERNVDLLLELLDRHGVRGTFFILGWVAHKVPGLARRVADAGHEIASHGSNHQRLHRMTPESFRQDLCASRDVLQQQTGKTVRGYRAPTFSIVRQTAWAIDVLAQAGFDYDASIFGVRHPWYGVPEAPDWPFFVQSSPAGATMLEVPALTWRLGRRRLAVAGGGYFRLLPLWFMNQGLRQAAEQGRPAILYFHPWEFDPGLPKMPLSLTGRLRTYTGLRRAAARLSRVLAQRARWTPIADVLGELQALAQQRDVFCLSESGGEVLSPSSPRQ
jgi:polysaccharide deacetylase family protein (PEP-CTERM system associated)